MRVVGVPVINGDPIEVGVEITFRIRHQLAGEGTQICHLASIFGRNYEPKMVAVVLTPFRKCIHVGVLRTWIEHTSSHAITGDALTFEVADVLG